MNNSKQAVRDDITALAQDARNLLDHTVGMTGEKAAEVRQRLASALESAKEICGDLQEKAAQGAKAADQVVRENPYQAMGIAFGIGVLIGVLATRQWSNGR